MAVLALRRPTTELYRFHPQYKAPGMGSPERRACDRKARIITAESGDDDIGAKNEIALPGYPLITRASFKLYLDDREKEMLKEMHRIRAKIGNHTYEDGKAGGVIDFLAVETSTRASLANLTKRWMLDSVVMRSLPAKRPRELASQFG